MVYGAGTCEIADCTDEASLALKINFFPLYVMDTSSSVPHSIAHPPSPSDRIPTPCFHFIPVRISIDVILEILIFFGMCIWLTFIYPSRSSHFTLRDVKHKIKNPNMKARLIAVKASSCGENIAHATVRSDNGRIMATARDAYPPT